MYADLLAAIRQRDVEKYEKELKKEQKKSNDQSEIERIQKKIEDAKEPGRLEKIANSSAFKILTNFLGGAFQILSFKSNYECDMMVERYEIYIVNILGPLLGLDRERVRNDFEERKKEFEAKRNRTNAGADSEDKDKKGEKQKSKTNVGLIFLGISKAFLDTGVTNFKIREKLQYVIQDTKLSQWHFDLFELFAPDAFLRFAEDPTKKVPKIALDKFDIAIDKLRNEGRASFTEWNETFVSCTRGTKLDSKVIRILNSAKLNEHFEKPENLTFFVIKCLKQIVKNPKIKFHKTPKKEKITSPDDDKKSDD